LKYSTERVELLIIRASTVIISNTIPAEVSCLMNHLIKEDVCVIMGEFLSLFLK